MEKVLDILNVCEQVVDLQRKPNIWKYSQSSQEPRPCYYSNINNAIVIDCHYLVIMVPSFHFCICHKLSVDILCFPWMRDNKLIRLFNLSDREHYSPCSFHSPLRLQAVAGSGVPRCSMKRILIACCNVQVGPHSRQLVDGCAVRLSLSRQHLHKRHKAPFAFPMGSPSQSRPCAHYRSCITVVSLIIIITIIHIICLLLLLYLKQQRPFGVTEVVWGIFFNVLINYY